MSIEAELTGQFEYELTDELLTRAALRLLQFDQLRRKRPRFWKKLSSLPPLLALALALSLLGVTFVVALMNEPPGDRSITRGILLLPLASVGLLLMVLLLPIAALQLFPNLSRSIVVWRSLRRVRKLAHRRIRYKFYEDRFESQAATHRRIVPWSQLREAYAVPEFWFLILQSRLTIYIPTEVLSAELQSLIRRKTSEAGAILQDWALPSI